MRSSKFNPLNYCCAYLPGAAPDEFNELDQELLRRGVQGAKYLSLETGGRFYFVPKTQINKLPRDEQGHYLGTDKSGYSMHSMNDRRVRQLLGRAYPPSRDYSAELWEVKDPECDDCKPG